MLRGGMFNIMLRIVQSEIKKKEKRPDAADGSARVVIIAVIYAYTYITIPQPAACLCPFVYTCGPMVLFFLKNLALVLFVLGRLGSPARSTRQIRGHLPV